MAAHASRLAYVRQLCCLEVEWKAVLPDLLRALETVIPSGPNVFLSLTRKFEHDHLVVEDCPGEVMRRYMVERQKTFLQGIESTKTFAKGLPSGAYFNYEDRAVPNFYNSELYQQIWRPMHQHHSLMGLLHEDGQLRAAIRLFRAEGDRGFNQREAADLERLLPYFAHCFRMNNAPSFHRQLLADARVGHILINGTGHITHQCEQAQRILSRGNACWGLQSEPDSDLPQLLSQLAAQWRGIQLGMEAPPPCAKKAYPGGELVFRAHGLHNHAKEEAMLTLVTVEHFELEPLLLMRGLRTLPLSGKERAVCFWLAQGLSTVETAGRVGIKPNTVKAYADSAYIKLDLHNRADLRSHVLAEAALNHLDFRALDA
jgi:DNA-binding CsgD family transcriptional regulator